jgi:hypothetical protein
LKASLIEERKVVEVEEFRKVPNDIWDKEMTPEEKYFHLYLLTNPSTTKIGIYPITKRQIAFDLDCPLETVHSLMERFIHYYKLIRYNPETRELAIKDWGKNNFEKEWTHEMSDIYEELRDVIDRSLIQYISESYQEEEMCSLFSELKGI